MAGAALPRGIRYAIIIAIAASWLPLAFFAKAWTSKSSRPRVHIFQDMDNQPKFKAQAFNPIFADHRAMRPPVPGTVARGRLDEDEGFHRGREGEGWVTRIPMTVDEPLLRRGRERFDIFCAPCHGLAGAGDGPVHQRALLRQEPRWVPPTSLVSDQVRERPVGHIFNSITHGIRTMPGYGTQIPPEDRWAIVAYVRALQLSRAATMEDVPPEKRDALR